MSKRTDSLLVRFVIIFAFFTVIAVAMSGLITFIQQTKISKEQKQDNLQQIASYLNNIIMEDGDNFIFYVNYITKHYKDIKIPLDFSDSDIKKAKDAFSSRFSELYPSKVLGKDVFFNDMPKELKEMFTVYQHEYYLDLFEKARKAFDNIYTYVCVPTDEPFHMVWLIDIERVKREKDGFLNLCFEDEMEYESHGCLWDTWESGKVVDGYDYYNNDYGRTYAYYYPLIIKGRKIGVIGTEIEIASVDKEILDNSLRQMIYIGIGLMIVMAALLHIINQNYILKLINLQKSVKAYTEDKNAAIASDIERENCGHDEISSLANQVSSMIWELENYMKSLLKTTAELRDTKQKISSMNDLAMKDALTGIRNKLAYDSEVKKIEWQMSDENLKFAIAMIDLNDLKKINTSFGHDKGNIAIKRLCYLVCHIFEHSPVFRIGEDEFVVILQNSDYDTREQLYSIFNSKIESLRETSDLDPWEKISASIGLAVYDRTFDNSVDTVFKRADKLMNMRKKEMKATREV